MCLSDGILHPRTLSMATQNGLTEEPPFHYGEREESHDIYCLPPEMKSS